MLPNSEKRVYWQTMTVTTVLLFYAEDGVDGWYITSLEPVLSACQGLRSLGMISFTLFDTDMIYVALVAYFPHFLHMLFIYDYFNVLYIVSYMLYDYLLYVSWPDLCLMPWGSTSNYLFQESTYDPGSQACFTQVCFPFIQVLRTTPCLSSTTRSAWAPGRKVPFLFSISKHLFPPWNLITQFSV